MMQIKDGKDTTEFKVTVGLGLLTAIVGVFVGYGVISAEAGEVVVQVGGLVVTAVVPIVLGWLGTRYTHARTTVKLEAMRSE